jgi:PAS domain S-box-containing protein
MTAGTPRSGLAARLRPWLAASIANRITFAAVCLTMAVVVALGVISSFAVRRQIADSVERDLEAEVRLVEQRLLHDLNSAATDVRDLAANSFIANGLVDSVERETYLVPFLREHTSLVSVPMTIALLDFHGQPVASNAPPGTPPAVVTAGIGKALETGRPQAAAARGPGPVLLTLAMPVIFPPTGQAEGVIVGSVDLERIFSSSMRSLGSGDLGDLLVAGTSITGGPGLPPGDFVVVQRRLSLPPPLDALSFTVELGRSKTVAFAALRWVALVYLLIGLVTLSVVLPLARFTSLRLVQPLASLSRTASEIAQSGSLNTAAQVSGSDEVGTLASVFNGMIEKLRVSRDELEALVEARTFQLRDSEQRLLLHVHHTPLAAIEWDTRARIVRWNPAAERTFGYAQAEAIGMSIDCIIPEKGRAAAHGAWVALLAGHGGSQRVEHNITKAGTTILCEWSHTTLTLAGGQVVGVASLAQDITARRQGELLTEIQRDLSTQLSFTSDQDAAFNHVLAAACRVEGIDGGGVYTVDRQTGALHLVAHRGLSPAFVARTAHYEPDCAQARLVKALQTVCRSREDLQRLGSEASEQEGIRSAVILPIAHEGLAIACLNLASHVVAAIPAATVEALESIAAQIGGTLVRLRAEADLAQSRRRLEELNRDLEARVERETRLRLEKERLLVQQSRLAAMGEMIGAIAHQWRQPLNSVAAVVQDFSDAQAFGVLDKPYLDRGVESAMRQIRFMSKTIDDFRNFFQPNKEKRPFDVKLAAAEVLTMLAPQLAAHRICCSISCAVHGTTFTDFSAPIRSCGEMQLLGYENEMKQVYLNLVSNAKDAILESRERSHAPQEAQGRIGLEFARQGGRILIRVTDNGGGIPAGVLERVFEPYFTTKEQGRGTGIGLYMSKMIVEGNMGGRITARNVDDGAEFTIEV